MKHGVRTDCTLILLAAGQSRRMRGADKLLQEVNGAPCLRVMAQRGRAAGLPVLVTLPDRDHPRMAALSGLSVDVVPVPDAREGMAASIRAAIAAVTTPRAMILPADMPDITTEDLIRVAQAPGLIVQARSFEGLPGHPVRFDQAFFNDLLQLTGDCGARDLLRRNKSEVQALSLPDRHAVTDLDTPEDWLHWRSIQ